MRRKESIQVYIFAYAHITQPLSNLHIWPYELVFHTQPRIPLSFQINFSGNSVHECTSQYCSNLPPHSYYQPTDLYPLFRRIMLKPISTWFLAIETAMLPNCSKIYQDALKKTNSIACTSKVHTIWHKKEKRITHNEIIWFHIILKTFFSFPTFNHTMNNILN